MCELYAVNSRDTASAANVFCPLNITESFNRKEKSISVQEYLI